MADLITFERLFWVALLAAGFVSGIFVGSEDDEPRQKVVYRDTVFDQKKEGISNPWDQVVLWKTPDSTDTREEDCVVPNWYPQLDFIPETPEVTQPGGELYAEPEVDLPGFGTIPITDGQLPIEVTKEEVSLQVGDPRTGRMLQFNLDVPEDTWRGSFRGTILGGAGFIASSSTFDLSRKTDFGLFTLGVGGSVAVVEDQVFIGPVGKIGYSHKVF